MTDILPAEWVIGVAQGLLDILTERDTEAKRGADRQGMTLWMEGGRFHQRDIDAAVEEQRAPQLTEERCNDLSRPTVGLGPNIEGRGLHVCLYKLGGDQVTFAFEVCLKRLSERRMVSPGAQALGHTAEAGECPSSVSRMARSIGFSRSRFRTSPFAQLPPDETRNLPMAAVLNRSMYEARERARFYPLTNTCSRA